MKMLQLLGDEVPQTPTGAPPPEPAGDFRPPDRLTNLFSALPQPLWAGDATAAVVC